MGTYVNVPAVLSIWFHSHERRDPVPLYSVSARVCDPSITPHDQRQQYLYLLTVIYCCCLNYSDNYYVKKKRTWLWTQDFNFTFHYFTNHTFFKKQAFTTFNDKNPFLLFYTPKWSPNPPPPFLFLCGDWPGEEFLKFCFATQKSLFNHLNSYKFWFAF